MAGQAETISREFSVRLPLLRPVQIRTITTTAYRDATAVLFYAA